MHITNEKDHLRQSIEQRIARMSDTEKEAEGRSVSRRVLEHVDAETKLCAYVPMKTEVDITLLLETVLEKDVPLFLPCFEDNKLVFRQTKDLSKLHKGTLGVMEPSSSAQLLDPTSENITVIVPGRAFDRDGNRMGRGNGGYDMWIAKQRKSNHAMQCIGICYECQLVDNVPVEHHDEVMDRVVTARDVFES